MLSDEEIERMKAEGEELRAEIERRVRTMKNVRTSDYPPMRTLVVSDFFEESASDPAIGPVPVTDEA